METRYAKRKKHLCCKSDELSPEDDRNGEDRISDLPNELAHRIFSFLPLEHVAKTCVLSKRWKYMWYSYPCLDFSTAFNSSYERDCRISGVDSAYQKQCDRIDEVLRLLHKHRDLRGLKFRECMNVSTLLRSMHVAVEQNVEKLDLEFSTQDFFDLPHCIVNSLSLRDLRLTSCGDGGLRIPPLDATKGCFKSLQSLYLCDADFRNHPSHLNLFSDSLFPSLAKLHLEDCSGLRHIRIQMSGLKFLLLDSFEIQELYISAKKLEMLSVTGCLVVDAASSRVAIDAPLVEVIIWINYAAGEFVIGKCDSLKEATVKIYRSDVDLSDSQLHGLSNLLNGISPCQSLTLIYVIEILSRNHNRLARLRRCVFDRLTSMEVYLSEDDSESQLWNEDIIDWESQAESLNLFLHHLKDVKIIWFRERSNEVGLVRLLMNKGKVLEQLLLLEHEDSPLGEDIKSEIMEFPVASSNVDIIFSIGQELDE